jgi:hypothetical protein
VRQQPKMVSVHFSARKNELTPFTQARSPVRAFWAMV